MVFKKNNNIYNLFVDINKKKQCNNSFELLERRNLAYRHRIKAKFPISVQCYKRKNSGPIKFPHVGKPVGVATTLAMPPT